RSCGAGVHHVVSEFSLRCIQKGAKFPADPTQRNAIRGAFAATDREKPSAQQRRRKSGRQQRRSPRTASAHRRVGGKPETAEFQTGGGPAQGVSSSVPRWCKSLTCDFLR